MFRRFKSACDSNRFWGLSVSAVLITAVNFLSCQSKSQVQFMQYFVQGEELYVKHCSNCHQKNGAGLGLLYPPLSKSDFMEANVQEVICLIRNGRKGELTVNGSLFDQPMPGVPSLTEIEIAEVATYIYNAWEIKRGLVDIKTVSTALSTCSE